MITCGPMPLRPCWPRLIFAAAVAFTVLASGVSPSPDRPGELAPAAPGQARVTLATDRPAPPDQSVQPKPYSDPTFPDEYAIEMGRFFLPTGDGIGTGFAVTDEGGIPFWAFFSAGGGVDRFGFPVSQRFQYRGLTMQAFQKSILQWDPANARMNFFNTLDELGESGFNAFLAAFRQVPPPQEFPGELGLPFEGRMELRLRLLTNDPAIEEVYYSNPNWLDQYGLPTAYHEFDILTAIRTQRAVFQHWATDGPWGPAGTVTIANAGDLAKEVGFLPTDSAGAQSAPLPESASRPTVLAADSVAGGRLDEASVAINRAYDLLWTDYAAWSIRPISVVIYGSKDSFADLNYNPAFDRTKEFLRTVLGLHVRDGDGMSSQLRLNLEALDESSGSLADTVTHEFVHAIQSQILGHQQGADWLIEGMAEAISIRAGNAPFRRESFDTTFSDALADRTLPSLTQLGSSVQWEAYGGSNAPRRWLAQTAAYRAATHLMDSFGDQVGLVILARMRSDAVTLDRALQSVTGLTTADLDTGYTEAAAEPAASIGRRPQGLLMAA